MRVAGRRLVNGADAPSGLSSRPAKSHGVDHTTGTRVNEAGSHGAKLVPRLIVDQRAPCGVWLKEVQGLQRGPRPSTCNYKTTPNITYCQDNCLVHQ